MKIKSKLKNYNVSFHEDIAELVASLSGDALWVVDSNVSQMWGSFFPKHTIFFSNEENKSFSNLENLIDSFVSAEVKKNTKIVAVGGGTLQDAIGFVCSIYNRGIDWTLVPTTLLSQADSCIGGKTSFNYKGKKNILGTFYPPTEIKLHLGFLSTLSQEQYSSGMGEILKFYILNNELHSMPDSIEAKIKYALEYKKRLIESDEFDKGDRVFLNFGHTFGHALESISNYEVPHGIAVMIGILIANRYAVNIGMLSSAKEQEICNVIKPWLSCEIRTDWFKFNDLMLAIKADKKNTKTTNMVLLSEWPEWGPKLTAIENFDLLENSLEEIRNRFI